MKGVNILVILLLLSGVWSGCIRKKEVLFAPEEPVPWVVDTTLVREMVGKVSLDSVRYYIQTLQDFGSRYSYRRECKAAGEWLYSTLSRWGLEVEYQPFLGNYLLDIFFINEDEGWVVGKEGLILHTDDGGQTWVRRAKLTLSSW